MMNKILILAVSLFFNISLAAARVTPITDWADPTTERIIPVKPQTISCAEKCPGYDITITYCLNQGEELESCPEKGCGYYHRCIIKK